MAKHWQALIMPALTSLLLAACGGSGSSNPTPPTPQAQLSLYAGQSGGAGFRDATGTSARFNLPTDVAVDAAGNTYTFDSRNNAIRKITPAGVVTTLAGGPNDNTLKYVDAMTVDAAGTVYVASGCGLRKITPAGNIIALNDVTSCIGFIDGPLASARLGGILYLATDTSGNLLVSDYSNQAIRKVTLDGQVMTLARTFLTGPQEKGVYSLTADAANNIYVRSDTNIYRVDAQTSAVTVAAASVATNLSGLTIDAKGNLYGFVGNNAPNPSCCSLLQIPLNGSAAVSVWQTSSVTDPASAFPARNLFFQGRSPMAMTPSGNLVFSDAYNSGIRMLTPSYQVSTMAGPNTYGASMVDGTSTQASFINPGTLIHAPGGAIYVADHFRFDPVYGTVDGSYASLRQIGQDASVSSLSTIFKIDEGNPTAFQVDSQGNVYSIYTDYPSFDHIALTQPQVRKTPSGTMASAAWSSSLIWVGSMCSNGEVNVDGDSSTTDCFKRALAGLTIDQTGAVYVSESNGLLPNVRLNPNAEDSYDQFPVGALVRKISPAGVMSTYTGANGTTSMQDGTLSQARFVNPGPMVTDSAGNIFVVDVGVGRIRKIGTDGNVSSVGPFLYAGSSTDGKTIGRGNITAIDIDGTGNLYVADQLYASGAPAVLKITPTGTVSVVIASAGPAIGGVVTGANPTLNTVKGMVVDRVGTVYLSMESAIYKVSMH